jgi:GR25 family glycosyltransferase involved in LPS biosynthesis
MAGLMPAMFSTLPIFVVHYKGHAERRAYLTANFRQWPTRPKYLDRFDRSSLPPNAYKFDDALFRQMIEPIKDVMIGYVVGLLNPRASWSDAVASQKRAARSLEQEFEAWPWLRPQALSPAAVCVSLTHRLAWRKIVQSRAEWAMVAEDDIIFREGSLAYLTHLMRQLPEDAEYIDIAGGCKLAPRSDNRRVNDHFFAIDPPRDRTVCAALIRRSFAQQLLDLELPICLPIDWELTVAFSKLGTKVYWVEPTVFGHGSDMNLYPSSTSQG